MKASYPRKKELTFRVIRVRGTLAKLLKRRTFKAVVRSPQEAIRFLLANYPELEGYMRPRYFQVTVGDCVVNEETIGLPTGVFEEICITPAICGAGGPVGQVITGIALITLSIFVPFVAPVLLPLGIGLALTGVAGLISPVTPDRPESTDSRDSYSFSGLQQTSREGPPVPLVYGEIVTGSVVLSVNIETDEEELGGGGGGGAAGDANALFESGTGNPNPDPNPVPDPPIVVPSGDLTSTWATDFPSGAIYGLPGQGCDPVNPSPAGNFTTTYTTYTSGPGPHTLVVVTAGSYTIGTAYNANGCEMASTNPADGYALTRPEYNILDADNNVIGNFLGNYPTSWGGTAHPDSTVWGFITPVLASYEQV